MIGDATRPRVGHVKRHISPGSRLFDDIAAGDAGRFSPDIHLATRLPAVATAPC